MDLAGRFRHLQPVLAKRGIDLTYGDKWDMLDPTKLSSCGGLVVYANREAPTSSEGRACGIQEVIDERRTATKAI